MDIHENARTTPRSRMLIVERLEAGSTVAAVASAFGVDGRTVRKWRDRFRVEGAAGLGDRSSRPHSCPFRLDAAAETEIAVLRRQRLSGPAIARRLGRPVSTVGKALRRIGLGRLKALDPAVAVIRYEREQPGELMHIDSKKLGRIDGIGHRITGDRRGQSSRRGRGEGLGWEALHVAIDDASRLAYTEILPDEKKTSATAFLERALGFFERHGIKVERVMTDNGSAYKSWLFRKALADRGIRHKRTRPYTPRTTDVIDKSLLDGSALISRCARRTAWRRAGSEVKALPRSLYRRPSLAASVRAFFGPRGFQPATKRA